MGKLVVVRIKSTGKFFLVGVARAAGSRDLGLLLDLIALCLVPARVHAFIPARQLAEVVPDTGSHLQVQAIWFPKTRSIC